MNIYYMHFKKFIENNYDDDIFGFDRLERSKNGPDVHDKNDEPIRQLDIERVMEFLQKIDIGGFQPFSRFHSEIQWGREFGAIKVEVEPGMRLVFKKLSRDLEGERRWVTTKMYQIDRRGVGGKEESIAQQIIDDVRQESRRSIPGPIRNYSDLGNLTRYIANKMNKVAQRMFIFEGIKKIAPNNYQIIFELGGQGVEAPDHQKVGQNVTNVSYDDSKGTIRITNYNVQSKVGRSMDWKLDQVGMDMYFFPSQKSEDIAEAVATRFKHY